MSNITLTGQASAPAAPGAGKYKLYIDDAGAAYVVDSAGTAVPVAPSGVDGAGGSDGQVWTADGAGGAAWETKNTVTLMEDAPQTVAYLTTVATLNYSGSFIGGNISLGGYGSGKLAILYVQGNSTTETTDTVVNLAPNDNPAIFNPCSAFSIRSYLTGATIIVPMDNGNISYEMSGSASLAIVTIKLLAII